MRAGDSSGMIFPKVVRGSLRLKDYQVTCCASEAIGDFFYLDFVANEVSIGHAGYWRFALEKGFQWLQAPRDGCFRFYVYFKV